MHSQIDARTLIHNLAKTDFDQNTIKLENGEIITTKKESFLKGRAVNPQQFNPVLTKLLEVIHSQKDILDDDSIVKDLTKISASLLPSNVQEETDDESVAVYKKVSQLMNEVVFYRWNHSEQPIQKIIEDIHLDKAQMKIVNLQFLENDLFSQGDLLAINRDFMKSSSNTIKKRIKTLLEHSPNISFIQVQGYPPIARTEMEKFLTSNISLINLLLPPVCIWEGPPHREIPLHPMLILNSDYMLGREHFLARAKKEEGKLTKLDFSAETLELINQHAYDLKSLVIDSENIEDVLAAADFFIIPTLKAKCDEFLSKAFKEEFASLEGKEVLNRLEEAQTLSEKYSLPELDSLSAQTVAQVLKDQPNMNSILETLNQLNEHGIKVKFLNLSKKELTSENLKQILSLCPSLTSLNLSYCTKLTDEIGPELAKQTQIKDLSLTGCSNFTDTIVKELANLRQLQSLNLSQCNQLTGAIGPAVGKFTQLQNLYLNGCDNLTDEIRTAFPTLTRLRRLNLSECSKLTDAMGSDLSGLRQLRILDLSHCAFTDAMGPELAKLTQIKDLNLTECPNLTDAIVTELANLIQLQSLNLSRCNQLTDAIGPDLGKFAQLQSLYLNGCDNLTSRIKTAFPTLTRLRHLNLSGCSKLTDDIMPELAKLIELRTLDLSGCYKFTDAMGSHLSGLRQLRKLDLSSCPITDAMGPELAKLTQIKDLTLSGCSRLTNAIVPHLTKLTMLQTLDLSNCSKLSAAKVRSDLEKLPHLRNLTINTLVLRRNL